MSNATTGAKTLVVGLGKSGLSCVRHLRARGIPTAVIDSRAQPPGLQPLRDSFPDVAVFLGGFDPEVFAAAERLVVSPGVPVAEPLIQAALARGVEVIGDIELFVQAARAPICAITGSNGKSTVTTLVGRMLAAAGQRVAVGGNLGEPALDLLDERVERYVLELSSFQLETTQGLRADTATVLNLSADHMDRYASLDDYAAAKARIYCGARVALVNRDDPRVLAMPRDAHALELGFTLGAPVCESDLGVRERDGRRWIHQGSRPLMPVDEVGIPGSHNLANALAALALAAASGVAPEIGCEVLRRFEGLPHRSVLVGERDGVRWYDDSKGTNPGATLAALEGLAPADGLGRVVLIAGGDGKGADFAPLRAVVERTARAVVLIGRDAGRIAAALDGVVPLVEAGSMREAVERAAAIAVPGDIVLLSPACASFDMFDGFEHRGRVFAEAVGGLTR